MQLKTSLRVTGVIIVKMVKYSNNYFVVCSCPSPRQRSNTPVPFRNYLKGFIWLISYAHQLLVAYKLLIFISKVSFFLFFFLHQSIETDLLHKGMNYYSNCTVIQNHKKPFELLTVFIYKSHGVVTVEYLMKINEPNIKTFETKHFLKPSKLIH